MIFNLYSNFYIVSFCKKFDFIKCEVTASLHRNQTTTKWILITRSLQEQKK